MSEIREIVLDTETSGLRIRDGHRIIEIGCVELKNKRRTGRSYQAYVNPQRGIDAEAMRVHGIASEFLQDKPLFSQIARDFLQFIGNSRLVIHNAAFDISFINYELAICGLPTITNDRVVDTLLMARKKYPGSPASLDSLCKRFAVSLETRNKHGALVDAELLASVYIIMNGATQVEIELNRDQGKSDIRKITQHKRRQFHLSDAERILHQEFLKKIKNHLWCTSGSE